MALRGIRGAITVSEDNAAQVLAATQELLEEIIRQNEIDPQDIASIIFTATRDLKSTFPAEAARAIGLHLVPLLCSQEIGVEGAMASCIRVLMHVNTSLPQGEIKHVFLRDAARLREDLTQPQGDQ